MNQITLFDTLENKKKKFEPADPDHVKIYVCGPTTYDDAHIGHARPCIVYDVLVRYLRSIGRQVTYVRNVTDIDDKIIQRANENQEEPEALAARMFESYSTDMTRLWNLSPDHQPKVSEHFDEIRALIQKLIDRGNAYAADGDVYFHVPSHADYGKLSHRKLDDMEVGASERLDAATTRRKKHPYDFALWKGAKEGEPSWESPWGPGRPGWHIECSAMSMKYLGETFDLHGGGLDLVFPHHENEIAQSECATGQCYCRHWMHNGFVQINKEKMSKSLGNFFRLREAFDKNEPEAVRYSLLTVHYRSPFNLEMDLDEEGALLAFPQFRDAEARLEYLYNTKLRYGAIGAKKIKDRDDEVPQEIEAFTERVHTALADDLNTAQAIGHLSLCLKAVNELCDATQGKKGSMSRRSYEEIGKVLQSVEQVLGLGCDDPAAFLDRVRDRRAKERGVEIEWVESCLARRAEARAAKDFAAADAVRDELAARGVEMLDTPQGTSWRLSVQAAV
ncbi:MAG: cysteine--tRNA ligase [Polyangiaceae bacterium]|nr:cysteine--tRNA ligase [Polyangiaceae bacterium]